MPYFQKRKHSDNVVLATSGLLEDVIWQPYLDSDSASLMDLVRMKLAEKMPGVNEKFNKKLLYFGYWTGTDKDRLYIYIRKDHFLIDLCMKADRIADLRKEGFSVEPRQNFQGQRGWLTGWQVPYSTKNFETVIDWLCKVFEERF